MSAGATCFRCGDALVLDAAPVAGIPVCLACVERGRSRFHPDSAPRPPSWILMRRLAALLGGPLVLGALVAAAVWFMLRKLTPPGSDLTSTTLGAGLISAGVAFFALATVWTYEIQQLGNLAWRDELTEQLGLEAAIAELGLSVQLAFLDFSAHSRRRTLERGELGLLLANAAGLVFTSATSEGLEAIRRDDIETLEWPAPGLFARPPRLRLRLGEARLTDPAFGRDRCLDFLAVSGVEDEAFRDAFPLSLSESP